MTQIILGRAKFGRKVVAQQTAQQTNNILILHL